MLAGCDEIRRLGRNNVLPAIAERDEDDGAVTKETAAVAWTGIPKRLKDEDDKNSTASNRRSNSFGCSTRSAGGDALGGEEEWKQRTTTAKRKEATAVVMRVRTAGSYEPTSMRLRKRDAIC